MRIRRPRQLGCLVNARQRTCPGNRLRPWTSCRLRRSWAAGETRWVVLAAVSLQGYVWASFGRRVSCEASLTQHYGNLFRSLQKEKARAFTLIAPSQIQTDRPQVWHLFLCDGRRS